MKKTDIFALSLIVFSFGIGIYLYPQLPDQMPMHWNTQGEIDTYGSKIYGTFLVPSINILLFFLFFYLPKIDPRKQNYEKFSDVYQMLRSIIIIFLSIIYLLTLYYSLNDMDNVPSYLKISFLIPMLVSILFILIGNYLGKVKDNYFVGIRTPWTLNSKEVWYKTHRIGAKLFVLSGVLGVIGSFFEGTISFIMLIGPILISVVYLFMYSYIEYKKEL